MLITSQTHLPPPVGSADVWEFPFDDGVVVARADVPSLFCMNQTASAIWSAYRQTGKLADAAESLAQRFSIPHALAARDVAATVQSWEIEGLLGPPRTIVDSKWDGKHGKPLVVGHCAIEGTVFLIVTDSPAIAAEVAPRLAGIRAPAQTPDVTIALWSCGAGAYALISGEECVAVEEGVLAARTVLFQELVCRARAGREWLALMHAAACGRRGHCILLPASSYSGKSTLAAAWKARGATLYSDDFVGLTAGDLRIPAMPFALALRQGSWPVLQSWIPELDHCTPVELNRQLVKFLPASANNDPIAAQAAGLVFSEWSAGAELSVQELGSAEVLGRLQDSGFWVRHDRGSIAAFLSWIERLPKFAMRYGDLAEAVAAIESLLDQQISACNVA